MVFVRTAAIGPSKCNHNKCTLSTFSKSRKHPKALPSCAF